MKYQSPGFSLVEVVVVMSLVATIFGLGFVVSTSSLARSTVHEERDRLVALALLPIRNQALTNSGMSHHSVFIDNSLKRYVLFLGATYSETNPTNRPIPFLNKRINVTPSSANPISFAALSAEVTSGTGTITLTQGEHSSTVEINARGLIEW